VASVLEEGGEPSDVGTDMPPQNGQRLPPDLKDQGHDFGETSAGNGDDRLGDTPQPTWVRSGAAELVYASDPVKQGYLTIWAAKYLLTGHHFRPGVAYDVGGPIGVVWYYPRHRELRLGQPLTITKANVDLYATKF
jgi:hypothetical protein